MKAARVNPVDLPAVRAGRLVDEAPEHQSAVEFASHARGSLTLDRKPECLARMLPLDELEPYLSRMTAMASGSTPGDSDRLPY